MDVKESHFIKTFGGFMISLYVHFQNLGILYDILMTNN